MINKKDFLLIIPARLKSSRLPNKLLIKIGNETVLKRVWLKCKKAVSENKIYVSTGDRKILEYCKNNKIKTLLTSKKCLTGTDRLIEIAKKTKAKFYVNVQGDEIFVRPNSIRKVIRYCKKLKNKYVVNAFSKIKTEKEFRSSSVPKVLLDNKKRLLYITRSPAPTNKNFEFIKAHKQVCIYAYPRHSLLNVKKNKKNDLERIEDIEILRFLESGQIVKMIEVAGSELAIDRKIDVTRAKKILNLK